MLLKSLIRPLIAAGFCSCAHAGPTLLDCNIALPAIVNAGGPVTLRLDLVNRGKSTIWVLDWNTPIEGLRNNYMKITGPTGELTYHGPMFKRGMPDLSHYHEMRPGQSLRASIDLTQGYTFATPGTYRLSWSGKLLDVVDIPAKPPRNNDAWHELTLRCPQQVIEIAP